MLAWGYSDQPVLIRVLLISVVDYFLGGCSVQPLLNRLNRLWKQLWRFFQKPSSRRRSPHCSVDWVIPGKLAVGSSPQPGDSALLDKAGIKIVFSLCSTTEDVLPQDVEQGFRCLRLVLPDSHYKNDIQPAQLKAAVTIIHDSVRNQHPIYVHCLAGVERSPTVCVAYLCTYQKTELWEALNWLKQVHPPSMPRESQVRSLRRYLQEQLTPQDG